MAIGKIASFFNGLSATDQTAPVETGDNTLAESTDRVDSTGNSGSGNRRDRSNGDSAAVAQQLGIMIAAIQQLNDNAVQQGAAAAVSSAGTQLRNAVTGLGHILATVDAQAINEQVSRQIKQADDVIDAVEAGVAGTQASTELVLRNLPAVQALAAQEAAQKFQTEMRQAIQQVRGSLAMLSD